MTIDIAKLRELTPPDICPKCDGDGQRAYGDTTCGRGGAGGQTITVAACNDCRGLGLKLNHNLRAFIAAARSALPALLDRCEAAEAIVAKHAKERELHLALITQDALARDRIRTSWVNDEREWLAERATLVASRDRLAAEVERLRARGYDVKTLRFSIRRKATP